MAVSEADFNFYRDLLYQNSGLALTPGKNYLLEARLNPVASNLGYDSLEEFTRHLKTAGDKLAIQAVVEAMTTNETSFFRDRKPFDRLKEILPVIEEVKQADRVIRIWSAACSSGQEPYSIAMIMDEFLGNRSGLKCEILGTDISRDILMKAEKGAYNQFEIQRGLPPRMVTEHFDQQGQEWIIKKHLRDMVAFKEGNLLKPLNHIHKFDIVMCRNVLIYFDNEAKTQALKNIAGKIVDGGYLFLGGCENLMGLDVPFEAVPGKIGLYKLKAA